MNNNNQQLAKAVTKALAYTENNGPPNPNNEKKGKTGETKSIFQFEPATWDAYSKEILGKDNVPETPDNETTVVYGKVLKALNEGESVPQIASMWNAGPAEMNAYTGKFSDGSSSVGTNKKYGVQYNVPDYAKKVENYTKEFLYGNLTNNSSTTNTTSNSTPSVSPQVASNQVPNSGQQQPQLNPAISKLMSIIQEAKQRQIQPQQTQGQGLLSSLAPQSTSSSA